MMTILGIPIVAILGLVIMAIGAYTCATHAEKVYREAKRERIHRKEVDSKIEETVDYCSSAYDHLKDPTVREAMVREIADEVYSTLASADIPLAKLFKSDTKVVSDTK